MQSKAYRLGPGFIANTIGNLCNPGTTTGGVNTTQSPYVNLRVILTHIRIVNTSGSAATVSMFIGASGGSLASTSFAFNGYSIPGNSYVDWYGRVVLDAADFMTSISSVNNVLSVTGEGEIMIA